jgi:hypothetical protein
MKVLTFLFLLSTSTWASEPRLGLLDIEKTINSSSVVSGVCTARTCFIVPREGVTSQDYQDEVSFIKKHLNGLGVGVRHGVFRSK